MPSSLSLSLLFLLSQRREHKTSDVMSQEDLDACLREVKMLDEVCDHINIISYLDSFLEDESLYIVLEWAHAGDLKRQIRKAQDKGARFDEILIWKIFTQVADALRHMHSKRTMHRDLKPANIFLSSDGTLFSLSVLLNDLLLVGLSTDENIDIYSSTFFSWITLFFSTFFYETRVLE